MPDFASVAGHIPREGPWGRLWDFFAGPLVATLDWCGRLTLFSKTLIVSAFTQPLEWREFLRQLDRIGSMTLPLAALAGAATGAVLSMQTRDSLVRFGAGSMLPAVIVYSLIKETGPIIAALMVSGRVGAGIGAELGSMKISEQIDAMTASAVNPYQYLAVTRVAACIVAMPLLTAATDFCGIVAGWIATYAVEPVTLHLFLANGFKGVRFRDFLPPTIKTALFGFIIATVSSFQGMNTRGGTEGVGRATTSAVVLSSLFVILADVVLVRLILEIFPS